MKLLLAIGLPLAGLALLQGPPKTPPMKMGLWEITTTSQMSGMQMPNGASMPAHTTKLHSCFTPENYQKNVVSDQRSQACARTNEVWTANSYETDISCPQGASGHVKVAFQPDSGHGTMHMNIDAGGRAMQMDGTYDFRYLGADCGKVSPDHAEVVH